MLDTLQSQIGVGAAFVVVGFAFLKGDEPERVGGGAFALALYITLLLRDDTGLTGPHGGLMAVDAAMLVIYAALAWKSRRSWPAWATGLQSIIAMTHILALVEARPPPGAFHAVIDLAGYGILLALALGVLRAWQERRAVGAA